jgi:hypothetical protein
MGNVELVGGMKIEIVAGSDAIVPGILAPIWTGPTG